MTGQRRIGILFRGDRDADRTLEGRYQPVHEALTRAGFRAEAVPFTEDSISDIREQLLQLDGVLVWVDPISNGKDRSRLDPLLREVALSGVWVSARPDVILKMGTKDVLVTTRGMGWGTDCVRYSTPVEMASHLPQRLASAPRVLKQHRGNGGNGVWKVQSLGRPGVVELDSEVEVLHAQRGSSLERLRLSDFVRRCEPYFAGSGCMIEQPYQERLGEGMIRCYLVRDRVAGFGHQFVTALLPPPEGAMASPAPPPRLYYGPTKPEFQRIRHRLEEDWVPEMQRNLDIDTDSLPVLWDADFLYGPRDSAGQDTYLLCEINLSSVSPFPDEALGPLVEAVALRLGKA